MTTCADILHRLASRLDGASAGAWEARLQFRIEGADGGVWGMEVKSGACSVTEGEIDAPSATVTTDVATWVGIHAGNVDPTQAFLTGKIQVTGDIGLVMKLNNPSIFRPV